MAVTRITGLRAAHEFLFHTSTDSLLPRWLSCCNLRTLAFICFVQGMSVKFKSLCVLSVFYTRSVSCSPCSRLSRCGAPMRPSLHWRASPRSRAVVLLVELALPSCSQAGRLGAWCKVSLSPPPFSPAPPHFRRRPQGALPPRPAPGEPPRLKWR